VNRVVLVDPAGDIGQVAAALEEIGWVQPECATAVPSGPGVAVMPLDELLEAPMSSRCMCRLRPRHEA